MGRLGVAHLGEAAGSVEVRDHDGERLVGTVLALPEALDRGIVGRVTGEVVATESLDRDRSAGADRRQRRREGVGIPRRRVVGECAARVQHRPALVTADRLGVVPAVGRVAILGRAGVAHVECRHRGVRPVVREIADDREARAAVRAGDEGVAEPTVVRVVHLGDAVVADRRVGRDQGSAAGHAATLDDPETSFVGGRARRSRHRFDPREWRCLGDEAPGELVDARLRSRHLDEHAGRVVADEPVEAGLGRQTVHERPEPDTLHDPRHLDPLTIGAPRHHPPIVAQPSHGAGSNVTFVAIGV